MKHSVDDVNKIIFNILLQLSLIKNIHGKVYYLSCIVNLLLIIVILQFNWPVTLTMIS